MLHPSYAELIKAVNNDSESENQVINSRYSIVLATAKRARQLIDGRKPLSKPAIDKPLSIAVDELCKGLVKIQPEEEVLEISETEQELTLEEEALTEDQAEVQAEETAAEETAAEETAAEETGEE